MARHLVFCTAMYGVMAYSGGKFWMGVCIAAAWGVYVAIQDLKHEGKEWKWFR